MWNSITEGTNACIPVDECGNIFRLPADLIDPSCQAAALYTKAEQVFPCDQLCQTQKMRDVLIELGMKTELDWGDLLDRTKQLPDMYKGIVKERTTTGQAVKPEKTCLPLTILLQLLLKKVNNFHKNKNKSKQNKEQFKWFQQEFQTTRFLIPKKKLSNYPLPWKADTIPDGSMVKPCDVYASSDMHIVSASQIVIEDSYMSESVKVFLGLKNHMYQPTDDLHQLECAIHCDPKTLDRGNFEHLQSACHAIYAYLNRALTNKDNVINN